MSTILDALRKVERERDPSPDQPLDVPPVTTEVRRRRGLPVSAVVICAVLGFSGGAFLYWLFPGTPEVEVAALPVPPPPPAIPVPRAPVRAQPAVAAPAEPKQEQAAEVASPPVAQPAPPAGAAPSEVASGEKPTMPAPVAAAPPVAAVQAPPAVAALEKQASALEPSPFSPPREAVRDAAPPAEAAKVVPPAATRVEAAPAGDVGDTDLAALEPATPDASEPPSAEADGESEPEPETPAETVVDTGRSPVGAPKVALSFLQWSADPARRFAFISIDGAPSQRVQEGEVTAGLTVASITKTGVQFKREGTLFVIRPRH